MNDLIATISYTTGLPTGLLPLHSNIQRDEMLYPFWELLQLLLKEIEYRVTSSTADLQKGFRHAGPPILVIIWIFRLNHAILLDNLGKDIGSYWADTIAVLDLVDHRLSSERVIQEEVERGNNRTEPDEPDILYCVREMARANTVWLLENGPNACDRAMYLIESQPVTDVKYVISYTVFLHQLDLAVLEMVAQEDAIRKLRVITMLDLLQHFEDYCDHLREHMAPL